MKLRFSRLNQRFPLFPILISVLVLCHVTGLFFCSRTYAQAYPRATDSTTASQSKNDNKSASIWSEFFFGKRYVVPKPQFVFTQTDALEKKVDNHSRQNSDPKNTLKKFFGLVPNNDNLVDAPTHVGSSIDNAAIPVIDFTPEHITHYAGSSLPSVEQFPHEVSEFSEKTVNELENLQSNFQRRIDSAYKRAEQSATSLQDGSLRLAHKVESNFQKMQNEVDRNLSNASQRGRSALNRTGDDVRHTIDVAKSSTKEAAQSLRLRANGQFRTSSKNEVDEMLKQNQQEIAKLRKQRLDELNAILAARKPREFTLHEDQRQLSNTSDKVNLDQLNQSMIRQTSSLQPKLHSQKQLSSPKTGKTPISSRQRFYPSSTKEKVVSDNNRLQQSSANYPISSERVDHNSPNRQTHSVSKDRVRPVRTRVKQLENGGQMFLDGPFEENAENQSLEEIVKKQQESVSRDVIKNGVIRSSAKFIDPKDL